MIDVEVIRENYSNMLDSQLILIAKNDISGLTKEALDILKQEFKKRNLDYSYIEVGEENMVAIHQEKIQKLRESTDEEFSKAIWKYVIEEKENGVSNHQILLDLQERGLDQANSEILLSSIETKLQEIIKNQETQIYTGVFLILLGFFISLYSYTSALANGGGKYYIITGLFLWGGIKLFKARSSKIRHKQLLAIVKKDSLSSSKTSILGSS